MQVLAGGALGTEVPHAARHDEIGDMARAVVVFREHMRKEAALAAEQEAQRQQAEADKRAALMRMADTIESETSAVLDQVEPANRRDGGDGAGHERIGDAHRRVGGRRGGRGVAGAGHRADRGQRRRATRRVDPRDRRAGRRKPPRWSAAPSPPAARRAPRWRR